MKKIPILCLIATLTACDPSPEKLGTEVRDLIQKKLNSSEMAEFHLKVDKVTVIHDQGNKYEGIATVEMDGESHDIPIHIIADGDNMMYQTDSGAFLFVAQSKIKKALASLAPDLQSNAPPPPPAPVQALINSQIGDYDACRNGSDDSPDTTAACARRNSTLAQIKALGWCWGHKDEVGSAHDWVRCAPGDM